MSEQTSQLEIIQQEIGKELKKKEVVTALLATTFKGLDQLNMQKAIFEGMMRGFKFKDFLEKNVYAIPFSGGYSLITSIDHARKIAIRSGVVGKSNPVFQEENGKIISCTITIKKKVDSYIGDFSETVYFQEYNTGRNLWVSKPRTMIAKVAEMHALRMACPEEMAKVYVEEEFQKERGVLPTETKVDEYKKKLEATTTLKDLRSVYASLPQSVKVELRPFADNLKKQYANTKVSK